jgi:rod shape-determining protein MreC
VSLRESPLGELKVPLTWTAAVAVIVAIVAVVAILMSDRRGAFKTEAYGATRGVADTVLTPVGDALSAPGRWTGAGVDVVRGYFFAVSENQRLKGELKEMRQWRDVALALRNENARYRSLLGLKTDPPIPMVAARVVLDSRGPFAATRLANAGSEKGVLVGNPVMSETGLVGRIVGVTGDASRVLLLTDTASKVPVMIDRTNARAILTGDGGPNPKLDYLRGQDPVREGDRVMTSGDGGVMPRGLPVGTAVKGLDGRWREVLASDKAPIDFVRILLFQDFTQLVNEKALEERRLPGPTAGGPTPPQTAKPAEAAAPSPKTEPGKPASAEKPDHPPSAARPEPAVPSKADGAAGRAKPADRSPPAGSVAKSPDRTSAARKPAEEPASAKASTLKPSPAKTLPSKTPPAKADPAHPSTARHAAPAAAQEPPH